MKTLTLIIMVAIILEALVEYAKTIMSAAADKEYKTAVTQLVTILAGIGLAFAFGLQLFNGAMSEFFEGVKINATLDMALTGILFSRGSNYFSDLVSRLTGKKIEYALVDEVEDNDEITGEDGAYAVIDEITEEEE